MEHIPIAELYCFRYCCSLFFFSRFFSEHFLFLRLLSLVAVGKLMCGEGRTDRSKQAAAREKNNQKSQPQNMRTMNRADCVHVLSDSMPPRAPEAPTQQNKKKNMNHNYGFHNPHNHQHNCLLMNIIILRLTLSTQSTKR